MRDFLSDFISRTFRIRTLLVTLLVAVVFVLSGPFGTFAEMSLVDRIIYWVPLSFLALAVGGFACEIEERVFPSHSLYQHGILSSIAFAIIYAPLVFLISRAGLLGGIDNGMPFWQVLMSVVAFAGILGLWIVLMNPVFEKADVVEVARPRLYARLPADLALQIAHITVSDHYVQVQIEDGSVHRLLMRFSDAVKEMDTTDGYCTHRSHWVARAFVKEGRRVGNKEVAELTNGYVVPVSKTYRQNLVAAGYLE